MQSRFEEAGYVTFPLIGEAERRRLVDLVRDVEVGSDPMDPAVEGEPGEHRGPLSRGIRQVFADAIDEVFDKHRIMFGALLLEPPHRATGTIMPRVDPTTLDEDRFVGCTVWAPLEELSLWGGTLAVLERSHTLVRTPRGTPFIPTPLDSLAPQRLAAHATAVPLRPGEAIAWNQKTMHWTPANRSASRKTAIALGVLPEEAELRHYYMTEAGVVEEYSVDEDFYVNLKIGQAPPGVLRREVSSAPTPIDEQTIRRVCGEGQDLRADLCAPEESAAEGAEETPASKSSPDSPLAQINRRMRAEVRRRVPFAVKDRLRRMARQIAP